MLNSILGRVLLLELPLLVTGGVSGRRNDDVLGINVFFNYGDLSIIVFTVSAYSPIGNDGQDPEHPKKNSDAASENECDSAALPRTQGHQCTVNAHHEGVTPLMELVDAVAGTMVLVLQPVLRPELRDLQLEALCVRWWGGKWPSLDEGRRGPNEGKNLDHSSMNVVTGVSVGGLDGRKTEGMTESVRDLDSLVLDALATRTTAGLCKIDERRRLVVI